MLKIRRFNPDDWSAVWTVIEPVFRSGETFPYSREITEKEAHAAWIEGPSAIYVAVDEEDAILGTYYLRPNQPTLGAHVANAGYIVATNSRGRGVASAMCEHSQMEAAAQGYRAMQFNLVLSTNIVAVRLWKKMGFDVVGTLPGAFDHRKLGFVDAFVMYKQLRERSSSHHAPG